MMKLSSMTDPFFDKNPDIFQKERQVLEGQPTQEISPLETRYGVSLLQRFWNKFNALVQNLKAKHYLPQKVSTSMLAGVLATLVIGIGSVSALVLVQEGAKIWPRAASACQLETDQCSIGSFSCRSGSSYECKTFSVYCGQNEGVWRPGGNACETGDTPAAPPSDPVTAPPSDPDQPSGPSGEVIDAVNGACPSGFWIACGGCLANKCVTSSRHCDDLIRDHCGVAPCYETNTCPKCIPPDTTCDGTTLQVCTEQGVWNTVQTDSPECNGSGQGINENPVGPISEETKEIVDEAHGTTDPDAGTGGAQTTICYATLAPAAGDLSTMRCFSKEVTGSCEDNNLFSTLEQCNESISVDIRDVEEEAEEKVIVSALRCSYSNLDDCHPTKNERCIETPGGYNWAVDLSCSDDAKEEKEEKEEEDGVVGGADCDARYKCIGSKVLSCSKGIWKERLDCEFEQGKGSVCETINDGDSFNCTKKEVETHLCYKPSKDGNSYVCKTSNAERLEVGVNCPASYYPYAECLVEARRFTAMEAMEADDAELFQALESTTNKCKNGFELNSFGVCYCANPDINPDAWVAYHLADGPDEVMVQRCSLCGNSFCDADESSLCPSDCADQQSGETEFPLEPEEELAEPTTDEGSFFGSVLPVLNNIISRITGNEAEKQAQKPEECVGSTYGKCSNSNSTCIDTSEGGNEPFYECVKKQENIIQRILPDPVEDAASKVIDFFIGGASDVTENYCYIPVESSGSYSCLESSREAMPEPGICRMGFYPLQDCITHASTLNDPNNYIFCYKPSKQLNGYVCDNNDSEKVLTSIGCSEDYYLLNECDERAGLLNLEISQEEDAQQLEGLGNQADQLVPCYQLDLANKECTYLGDFSECSEELFQVGKKDCEGDGYRIIGGSGNELANCPLEFSYPISANDCSCNNNSGSFSASTSEEDARAFCAGSEIVPSLLRCCADLPAFDKSHDAESPAIYRWLTECEDYMTPANNYLCERYSSLGDNTENSGVVSVFDENTIIVTFGNFTGTQDKFKKTFGDHRACSGKEIACGPSNDLLICEQGIYQYSGQKCADPSMLLSCDPLLREYYSEGEKQCDCISVDGGDTVILPGEPAINCCLEGQEIIDGKCAEVEKKTNLRKLIDVINNFLNNPKEEIDEFTQAVEADLITNDPQIVAMREELEEENILQRSACENEGGKFFRTDFCYDSQELGGLSHVEMGYRCCKNSDGGPIPPSFYEDNINYIYSSDCNIEELGAASSYPFIARCLINRNICNAVTSGMQKNSNFKCWCDEEGVCSWETSEASTNEYGEYTGDTFSSEAYSYEYRNGTCSLVEDAANKQYSSKIHCALANDICIEELSGIRGSGGGSTAGSLCFCAGSICGWVEDEARIIEVEGGDQCPLPEGEHCSYQGKKIVAGGFYVSYPIGNSCSFAITSTWTEGEDYKNPEDCRKARGVFENIIEALSSIDLNDIPIISWLIPDGEESEQLAEDECKLPNSPLYVNFEDRVYFDGEVFLTPLNNGSCTIIYASDGLCTPIEATMNSVECDSVREEIDLDYREEACTIPKNVSVYDNGVVAVTSQERESHSISECYEQICCETQAGAEIRLAEDCSIIGYRLNDDTACEENQ